MGISGTTAKSRKHKFVPLSLSLVLIFCERMSKLCKNPAMLFHEDMIYLAKQAKLDVEKKLCFEMRTVIKSNIGTGFLQFYVKTKKVCRCLPVLAQNKSILHMACS